jgi:DNA-binding CsgD family transcriptional regulator
MEKESRTVSPMIDPARVWTLIARGRPQDARRIAGDAIERAIDSHCWGTALDLAHDLARIGGIGSASEAAHRIGDRVDGPLAVARRAHINGLAGRDPDLLELASKGFEELGAMLFAAESAADAGRAAAWDGEARRSTRLFRRASELAGTCEDARTPALLMPSELTPLTAREREVASLAAGGLSSDAIAQRLFVSVRTVDNHMQHVYQKLGIASRKELSAALGARGLEDASPRN